VATAATSLAACSDAVRARSESARDSRSWSIIASEEAAMRRVMSPSLAVAAERSTE